MFKPVHTIDGFLRLIIGITIAILGFILLAHLLLLAAAVAFIIFVCYWLRVKLFPNSIQAQKYNKFRESINSVKQQRQYYKKQSTGSYYDNHHNHCQDYADEEPASNKPGRIIDIEPENHHKS